MQHNRASRGGGPLPALGPAGAGWGLMTSFGAGSFVLLIYLRSPRSLVTLAFRGVTDGIGGSPYGPGTLAGTDGSRQPVEAELTTERNLGSRLARVAGRLKDLRVPQ